MMGHSPVFRACAPPNAFIALPLEKLCLCNLKALVPPLKYAIALKCIQVAEFLVYEKNLLLADW